MNWATLRDWVKQWAARLVRYGILAQTDSSGFDQLEGTLGEPGEPSFQHPIRRFQHYGFRSRPRVGAELICVAPRGGTSNRVSIASEVPGQGPSDQDEGEVELYSEFGQRIRLSNAGRLIILTKAGNQIELREDGSLGIKDSFGGEINFANTVFSVDQTVESQHFQGKGAAPIAVPGPGLGGGIASALGSDAGFHLSFTVFMSKPGPLATVLFSKAYSSPPHIGVCAIDSPTATAMKATPFYVIPSHRSLQIFADGLLPGLYNLSLIIMG